MCTVLQQHLNNQLNGFSPSDLPSAKKSPPLTSTPAPPSSAVYGRSSSYLLRNISPVRSYQPTYSYLQVLIGN